MNREMSVAPSAVATSAVAPSAAASAGASKVGPVLEIRDLSIALPRGGDRKRAVAGVSLTVNRGEIVCLVGESGSGKSVIAQAVMGLLPKQLPVLGGAQVDGL